MAARLNEALGCFWTYIHSLLIALICSSCAARAPQATRLFQIVLPASAAQRLSSSWLEWPDCGLFVITITSKMMWWSAMPPSPAAFTSAWTRDAKTQFEGAALFDGVAAEAGIYRTNLALLSSSLAFMGSLPPSKTMTGITPAAFMTSTLLTQ